MSLEPTDAETALELYLADKLEDLSGITVKIGSGDYFRVFARISVSENRTTPSPRTHPSRARGTVETEIIQRATNINRCD
jgi:hypothetical protein